MALSSAQLLGHHPNAILNGEAGSKEDFVVMNTLNNCHSFKPNHPSEHSASVSPPSFDAPPLAEFGDEDELEDESFGSGGKFHSRFNSLESKDDHHQKPLSAAQANKLKISTAERRATHNAIERARRESLNCRFLELARALPTMSNVKRPSKSAIVNKSLEFICESQVREYNLMRENNYLRAQVNELRAQLRMSPLPPPSFGTPLHLQHQRPMPSRSAPLSHHSISLPVGGPTLPPTGRPLGDGLAQINPPLSSGVGCFSMANTTKDTYAHPHDQAAGPFLAHHHQHHRSQSFPVNSFNLLGSTDAYGALHHHHHPSSTDGIGPTDPISFHQPDETNAMVSSPPNLTKTFYSSDEEGSGGSPPNIQNSFNPDSLDIFGNTTLSPNPNQLAESIIDIMQAQSNVHTLPESVSSGSGTNWLKSESAGFGAGLASTYNMF